MRRLIMALAIVVMVPTAAFSSQHEWPRFFPTYQQQLQEQNRQLQDLNRQMERQHQQRQRQYREQQLRQQQRDIERQIQRQQRGW